jgi:hypothetical protein
MVWYLVKHTDNFSFTLGGRFMDSWDKRNKKIMDGTTRKQTYVNFLVGQSFIAEPPCFCYVRR